MRTALLRALDAGKSSGEERAALDSEPCSEVRKLAETRSTWRGVKGKEIGGMRTQRERMGSQCTRAVE